MREKENTLERVLSLSLFFLFSYGRLWECVIRLANDRVSDLKPNERAHTIALLDFAGFGTQAENSFEQVREKTTERERRDKRERE